MYMRATVGGFPEGETIPPGSGKLPSLKIRDCLPFGEITFSEDHIYFRRAFLRQHERISKCSESRFSLLIKVSY
jgi:hypothetical protein